jgi:hypothetical protein
MSDKEERMYKFYRTCVDWPRREAQQLIDMIDAATDITRRSFLKHVDREQLRDFETAFGYTNHHKQGLTMAGDYHVSYHRSKLDGKRVYFFKHSGIEYVFTSS